MSTMAKSIFALVVGFCSLGGVGVREPSMSIGLIVSVYEGVIPLWMPVFVVIYIISCWRRVATVAMLRI